jgi:hypothetical protein
MKHRGEALELNSAVRMLYRNAYDALSCASKEYLMWLRNILSNYTGLSRCHVAYGLASSLQSQCVDLPTNLEIFGQKHVYPEASLMTRTRIEREAVARLLWLEDNKFDSVVSNDPAMDEDPELDASTIPSL